MSENIKKEMARDRMGCFARLAAHEQGLKGVVAWAMESGLGLTLPVLGPRGEEEPVLRMMGRTA